jgi:1,5-anhydro-D-fructose reductase (1,5-anhydro-D-mannitol-forming)
MADRIRIAMLSMAHVHAWGYAEQVQKLDNAEIVCIWDDNEARGTEAATNFGVPFVSEISDALDRDDVDAVVVNSTTRQHKDVYLAAIKAGKHIFTEKTLTLTTKDADEVVKAANKSGVKFAVSLPSRAAGENMLIKQLIDDGAIGEVTMIRARIAHSGAMLGWFDGHASWFVDEKEAGGGALFDLGCHTTDLMRWMMGQPKSAVALMNSVSGKYDIDDNSAAVIEFENGAIGVLDTAFVHTKGPNLFEVYGKKGYIAKGLPGQGFYLDTVDEMEVPDMPASKPSIMENWLSAIQNGDELITTVEDGRNLTEMLAGIYTAWRSGKRHDFS